MPNESGRKPADAGDDDQKDQSVRTGSQSEAGETHKTEELVSLDSEELDEVEE